MNTQKIQSLSAICLITIGMAGCSGLSKMSKDADKVHYAETPNPMQENGDSVAINIAVNYPAKYFAKKAIVTVVPTLKLSDGTEYPLKSATLIGDNAKGTGIKIHYKEGGNFNYTTKVAYTPGMKTDALYINATLENNKKKLPSIKIADGTITTAKLMQADDKVILGKDNFKKTIPESDTTHIYYVISQSTVRSAEMRSKEMKKLKEFVKMGTKEGYTFDNVSLSAYASPDGETQFNDHLADDRAKTAIKAMRSFFREMNTRKLNTKFGTEASFYQVGTTGMDWEGFKTRVEASNIKDKAIILRVLTMYSDHDQRMREIKALSLTYKELAERILPELRRSVIVLNAEKKSPTDEQIKSLLSSDPKSLTVEEMLYAATLTHDLNRKMETYQMAAKQYPNDWRCPNDIGYIDVLQNNLTDAKMQFTKAEQLSPNNPVIENNLGVMAHINGNRNEAMRYFKNATGAGNEVSYNMGLLDIQSGNYSEAVSNMSSYNTFNTALAKLLNNDVQGAESTLDASNDNSAMAYYLKAIIAARTSNKTEMMNDLKTAIGKDASLKQSAKTDCEFIKYSNDADFKSLIS